MSKKVCIVTGTRAEYGILKPLMKRLKAEENLELQIVATGMHLSPEFGLTYKNIENDGFIINEKLEVLMSSDTPVGVSKSMGLTLISFAEAYERLKPDMIVILGDRYETFSAMAAASVTRIPVAHIHGGEVTEGAFDEAFRHSMSKMAYLHFTSTETYRRRVIQLGEDPMRVFNVGAMGVENAMTIPVLSKKRLEKKLSINLGEKYFLILFHPVTLEDNTSAAQMKGLLKVISTYKDYNKVFIKGNSDTEGRIINEMIEKYVSIDEKAFAFSSLPVEDYMNLIRNSECLIGNSSSGIIEAPSFGIPTLNIGDRQKGRIKAESVMDCPSDKKSIKEALSSLSEEKFKEKIKSSRNPYDNGNSSEKILNEIKNGLFENEINLKKIFYDINFEV